MAKIPWGVDLWPDRSVLKKLLSIIIILCLRDQAFAQHKPAIEWVTIPAGTFSMGSIKGEFNRETDEIPHQVTLSAFKMGKYEVTVARFKTFIDATGYVTDAEKGTGGVAGTTVWRDNKVGIKAGVNWKCDESGKTLPVSGYNRPVIHVSWNDAAAFASWMDCRLPTEAEWEYACRAGTSTPFNTGNNLTPSQADFDGNFPYIDYARGEYRGKPVAVGSFEPNAWGLYDMHGNVCEWCSDWYDEYPAADQTNPKGAESGEYRVFRGGSWNYTASQCRSAYRSYDYPVAHFFVGFRLVNPR